ncbi:hypothetical protein Hdeb2414_s0007g00231401 [Helianthus debilis subsp. tardiflorus]
MRIYVSFGSFLYGCLTILPAVYHILLSPVGCTKFWCCQGFLCVSVLRNSVFILWLHSSRFCKGIQPIS